MIAIKIKLRTEASYKMKRNRRNRTDFPSLNRVLFNVTMFYLGAALVEDNLHVQDRAKLLKGKVAAN